MCPCILWSEWRDFKYTPPFNAHTSPYRYFVLSSMSLISAGVRSNKA